MPFAMRFLQCFLQSGFEHFVFDRFKAVIVRLFGGAGGQTDNQIHLRNEIHVIPRLAPGGLDRDFAGFAVHVDVHEYVESDRYLVGCDAKRRERFGQVAVAAAVRMFVAVEDMEGVGGTGCQQKVMASCTILADPEHRPAAVGIQEVAGCQEEPGRVVERAPRGQVLLRVVEVERNQVGDLLAPRIDDPQPLAGHKFEGDSAARGDFSAHETGRSTGRLLHARCT